jgi:hypothetical protein
MIALVIDDDTFRETMKAIHFARLQWRRAHMPTDAIDDVLRKFKLAQLNAANAELERMRVSEDWDPQT